MDEMFTGCKNFLQDISRWDTSSAIQYVMPVDPLPRRLPALHRTMFGYSSPMRDRPAFQPKFGNWQHVEWSPEDYERYYEEEERYDAEMEAIYNGEFEEEEYDDAFLEEYERAVADAWFGP